MTLCANCNAQTPKAVVCVTNLIGPASIQDLVKGEILAIRIPGFYDVSLCDKFSRLILDHERLEHYAVAPDIQKVGKSIFDAAEDPAQLEEYYKVAGEALADLRSYFHPYLAPMDKLRLTLQEAWPAGSMMENLHGRLMFCGLLRAFSEGSEARPHQDMTHWDVPLCWPAKSMQTQIATNIYLSTADDGGALELWGHGIKDEDEYHSTKVPGDYGLDRNKVGLPVVSIVPEPGDLIMFDARRIHAVTRINKGIRIASGAFIGYRGQAEPLTVFS